MVLKLLQKRSHTMVRNVFKMLKNRKGFTLVEVIVVAVIVAVLAAVAIPLYLGYVESSKANVANNLAGSAASFLAAAKNTGKDVAEFTTPLVSGSSWTYTPPGATTAVKFTCPEKCTIDVNTTTVSVRNDGTKSSGTYSY